MFGTVQRGKPFRKQAASVRKSFFVRWVLLFSLIAGIGYLSQFTLIEIDIESGQKNELQVFWAADKEIFAQQHSDIKAMYDGRHRYRFIVDQFNKATQYRIDPGVFKGIIKIHGISFYSLLYYPVHIDLFNDPVSSDQIVINRNSDPNKVLTLNVLDVDPKLELKPVFDQSPLFLILTILLMLIVGVSKKNYLPVLISISLIALGYWLLDRNHSRISFYADAKEARNIKILWRDVNEPFSNGRSAELQIKPGKHFYSKRIGQFTNIEKILIIPGKNPVDVKFSNIQFQEPGFQTFNLDATDLEYYYAQLAVEEPPSYFKANELDYNFFLEKQAERNSLLNSLVVFLALTTVFLLFCQYSMSKHYYYFLSYFPDLVRCCFLIAAVLISVLAWQADYNLHPDEHNHIQSIKYYSQYWDPPSVGDPRALATYQFPWAVSRIHDLGTSYFFAGKFREMLSWFVEYQTYISRAFNSFLWVTLVALAWHKRRALYLLPLLCTPQIAYLFAYANRGAPDLFLSVMLGWQLAYKGTSLNRYLHAEHKTGQIKPLILPGVLLGLLSIEQTNYILFNLYLCAFLGWNLLFMVPNKKQYFTKCLLFLCLGAGIFLLRYCLDVGINGFDKWQQMVDYAELNAADHFKPSQATNHDSYIGLRLMEKGVRFTELFSNEWEWHKISFESFTGFYGYYAELSPRWYYIYSLLLYILLFGIFVWQGLTQADWRYKLFNLMSWIALSGGAIMSLLFSWIYDFQPQGRYMFPVIPILLVYLQSVLPHWSKQAKALLAGIAMLFIVLSFFSFYRVAMNYVTA